MDSGISNLKFEQKKNAEKCLSRLLDYSKNAKRNYSTPQNILKYDKKDLGNQNKGSTKKVDPNQYFASTHSDKMNKFMNKYMFDNIDSQSTNIIMLNKDEFIRLKAGGSELSKTKIEHISETTNTLNNTEKEANGNETQPYADDIDTNRVEEHTDQIKANVERKKQEFEFIKPSYKQAQLDKKECIPSTKSKLKLTILDFDKIMNYQLKKRTMTQLGNIVPSAMETERTAEKESKQSSTVKSTVINSAVSGTPNIDRHFSEDYELMNAIDCFMKAEDACHFEQTLQAAEMAAKHAPLGFEEEAAAEAARHFKFQYQLQNDLETSHLDKTKKAIEIVAYVGCTSRS